MKPKRLDYATPPEPDSEAEKSGRRQLATTGVVLALFGPAFSAYWYMTGRDEGTFPLVCAAAWVGVGAVLFALSRIRTK